MKGKGKNKMIGWIIALVILVALAIGGRIGWSLLEKEHKEARELPLDGVDFSRLNDGAYTGSYAGGMYRWRANEARVVVSSGRVTQIELLQAEEKRGEGWEQALYDRVITAQSLQVDTISGATLTSKAYLQAVENALLKAQHD